MQMKGFGEMPLRLPYLWDFPPSAVVRVSGEAGGVIRTAGRGGRADTRRRRDAGVPAGLAEFQELKTAAF